MMTLLSWDSWNGAKTLGKLNFDTIYSMTILIDILKRTGKFDIGLWYKL